jgi:hypothetical protein
MINLPKDIDYSKYTSKSGISTKYWGPKLWDFLFVSIIGNYPMKMNNSIECIVKKNAFKNLLTNLTITLPCIFCRNSFKEFIIELPIEPYLIGKIELMYWLYLMKDKVNKKLIYQEKKCYNDEKKRLKVMFYSKQISENEYYTQLKTFKEDNFVTQPTPSFKSVLDKYENKRAKCDKKAKKCSILKYPQAGEE